MAKKYYERHSLALALQPYLVGQGWTGITEIFEGWPTDNDIAVPMVSLYFLPSRQTELQMGRSTTSQKSYLRAIQFYAYMETEDRADSIIEDIADFLDQETIAVVAPDTSVLGSMFVENSETITTNSLPPNLVQSKVIRWRGICQAQLGVYYNS